MTGGILTLFYVQPYKDATGAALYERLRYGIPREMQGAYYEERQAERQTGNRAENQAEQQESPAENQGEQGGETV